MGNIMTFNNQYNANSIALLSGKGGSGKTTLALTMASLLSDCGIKVLLVDCDLSTNGATYFFEDKLKYHSGTLDYLQFYLTNYRMISLEDGVLSINSYPVNDTFDFLPSILDIDNPQGSTDDEIDYQMMDVIAKSVSGSYDVVIYDCEAGYTEILKYLLPRVDRSLVVMEADAISASAVRNLFLRTASAFQGKKIFQVFNKTTKEENEIYSKLSSGTMFTNLGCISFDWTVRKAFSLSEIPDLNSTSMEFGRQVGNVALHLLYQPSLLDKLNHFLISWELSDCDYKINRLAAKAKTNIAEIKEYDERKKDWDIKHKKEQKLITTQVAIGIALFILIAISTLLLDNIYQVDVNDFSNPVIMFLFVMLTLSVAIILRAFFKQIGISRIPYNEITDFRKDYLEKIVKNEDLIHESLTLNKRLLELQIDVEKCSKTKIDFPEDQDDWYAPLLNRIYVLMDLLEGIKSHLTKNR